jgi:hypothetical protein
VNATDNQLDAGMRRLGLSVLDLWIDYIALGGNLDIDRLNEIVAGSTDTASDVDHDMIAHALNERFRDLGQDSPIAYRRA